MTAGREDMVRALHELQADEWARDNEPVKCAGNQHTCMPVMYVPALDRRYELVLRGTGDSTIVGHHLGPRALVWDSTELTGSHPDLGDVRMTLLPERSHAGTLVPLLEGRPMPAINRNTYFFLFQVERVGELISARPAIVEAIIDEVPPTARYEFKNGPLAFHLRDDPERRTVAMLESAVTDVRPAAAP